MSAEVIGIDQLSAEFRTLQGDIQRKVGRRMVAAGAGLVQKESKKIAKSKGLVKSGALLKNIVKKRDRHPRKGEVKYYVKVRHGRELKRVKGATKYLARSRRTGRVVTKRRNDPFYWRYLEGGTKRMRRHPFLRPAMAIKRSQIPAEMEKAYQKSMTQLRRSQTKNMVKWGYK